MTFNSLQYAAFFPVVLAIYWALRKRQRQNALLLAASYVFYGAFDWRFLGLLWLSTITDFTVGRLLDGTDDERRRKVILFISLVVNLGVLGFFKYFDFFTTEATQFLDRLGLQVSPPLVEVLLPVGISFYTFHGISYTVDVYRRHIEPTRDLLAFAVFVAFFPQLVAGPIGRAHLQLPQFENERRPPDMATARGAVAQILIGLFQKVVIADSVALYVNTAFTNPRANGTVTLIVGVYGFALQIYGDFAGYSNIARGSARLLGVDLPVNFREPYLSRSITEFWRRWHISLSTWLRDYLYVPLGGNRGGRVSMYRNLILTMLLGGLWHGAAMTFLVWGGLHGLFLAIERAVLPAKARDAERPIAWVRDLVPMLITFHLVCAAWVFFRAQEIGVAREYFKGLVSLRGGVVNADAVAVVAAAGVAALLLDLAQRRAPDAVPLMRGAPLLRGAAIGAVLLGVVVFSGGTPVPFIYFQF